ncbi:DUF1376 domain-containing protein [Muricauda sp. MAR_2010_75]|uniref:DUF7833 domain-containing protein n=1 Tax=Allomuricauda sp. MAR_2010_75 TaxID=1250232 RepID=UPI00055B6F24|nr:DUF1376 domain-containing protein [Muricauda sp. MAR_2010_75]
MNKDFTFPFYYKEWLVSTQGMPADVRGWYINLLCHQADKQVLPNNIEDLADLAGVKISEYQRFVDGYNQWLHHKFNPTDNGGLENAKMKSVLNSRKEYLDNQAKKSKVAVFIRVKRKEHSFDPDVWKLLSSKLMDIDTSYLSKKEIYKKYESWFNQWLNQRLNPSIENDNDNIYITNKEKGGVGEKTTIGFEEVVDLDLVKNEIKNSITWKEGIVRTVKNEYNKQFSLTKLDELLERFDELIWNDGETEKSLKGYKKHFNRWLIAEYQKNANGKSVKASEKTKTNKKLQNL